MAVLSLADAKTHLNITGTDDDSEITDTIDEAEAVIARLCGPLESTAVTERVRGGGLALLLSTTPVISLTSVTPLDGSAISSSYLLLNGEAGVVERKYRAPFNAATHYDVVYTAGRSTCPDDLLRAVKELVRHLWMTQRGQTRRPGSAASDSTSNTLPGAAYVLPFRVTQLITTHTRVGIG